MSLPWVDADALTVGVLPELCEQDRFLYRLDFQAGIAKLLNENGATETLAFSLQI